MFSTADSHYYPMTTTINTVVNGIRNIMSIHMTPLMMFITNQAVTLYPN